MRVFHATTVTDYRWVILAAWSSLVLVAPALATPVVDLADTGVVYTWFTAAPILAERAPAVAVPAPVGRWDAAAVASPTQRLAWGYIDERGQKVNSDRPTRSRTILYSALVPGLGQLQWGDKPAAVGFMLGEVASWASYLTFRIQGNLREDRYVEYAERFAGVQRPAGQSNQYYQALGRYNRSDPGPGSYNEIEVRMVAKRELYPDDPAAQERYIAENSISGDRAWNWESESRRLEYASIRSSSESSRHRADFAIGGMVAGRILSVMHAIWLTADRSESDEQDENQPRQPYDQSHNLAQAVRPYFKADLDGDCQLGIRTQF